MASEHPDIANAILEYPGMAVTELPSRERARIDEIHLPATGGINLQGSTQDTCDPSLPFAGETASGKQ